MDSDSIVFSLYLQHYTDAVPGLFNALLQDNAKRLRVQLVPPVLCFLQSFAFLLKFVIRSRFYSLIYNANGNRSVCCITSICISINLFVI